MSAERFVNNNLNRIDSVEGLTEFVEGKATIDREQIKPYDSTRLTLIAVDFIS